MTIGINQPASEYLKFLTKELTPAKPGLMLQPLMLAAKSGGATMLS